MPYYDTETKQDEEPCMLAEETEAPIVERFGGYDLLAHPGHGETLLLSIASLGLPDGSVPFEWRHMLSQVTRDEHVVFLRDTRQSWYNAAEGWDAMVAWLLDYQARHDIRRTVAFGLSMGGSGALVLSHVVTIDEMVLLGPQVCLGEMAGFDRRYQGFWSNIAALRWPHLGRVVPQGSRPVCGFSIDIAEDVLHAAALAEAVPGTRLVGFRGVHNLGAVPYLRSCQRAFMREIIGPAPGFGQVGGFTPSAGLVPMARIYLDGANPGRDSAMRDAVAAMPPSQVPAFAYPWLASRPLEAWLGELGSYGAALAAMAAPAHIGRMAISGPDIHPYLPFGWSDAEAWGVWSIGRWHVIRARLHDEPEVRRLELLLEYTVWLPDRRPYQTIRFLVAGRVVHEERLEGEPGASLPGVIRLPCEGPVVEVLIETPDAIAPAEASDTNPDPRPLAIGLSLLGFAPAETPPD